MSRVRIEIVHICQQKNKYHATNNPAQPNLMPEQPGGLFVVPLRSSITFATILGLSYAVIVVLHGSGVGEA